jgi:hypothetical protein
MELVGRAEEETLGVSRVSCGKRDNPWRGAPAGIGITSWTRVYSIFHLIHVLFFPLALSPPSTPSCPLDPISPLNRPPRSSYVTFVPLTALTTTSLPKTQPFSSCAANSSALSSGKSHSSSAVMPSVLFQPLQPPTPSTHTPWPLPAQAVE